MSKIFDLQCNLLKAAAAVLNFHPCTAGVWVVILQEAATEHRKLFHRQGELCTRSEHGNL
jgi:hypothetical protein